MRRFLLVGLVVLSAGLAFGQRVTVEATVNARRIGIEDVLELTVSVNGGNGTPRFPSIDGFRVSGPSTSSRFSIVNGRTSSTSSFTYQLVPQSEGTFTIPAIPVDVDGRTYETAPIRVEVVAGSVMPRRPRSRGFDPFGSRQRRREPEITAEDVFVRADVSKRSVYQGEGVVITYRVYSKYMPHGPEVDDDPPLTGFWVEEVNLGNPSIERQVVNGQEYLTFPMKQRVVFPARTGELTIPLLTLSMAFRITSSDPFDAFFARASRPIVLRSSAVTLDVKPLPPQGRGRDFTGAVGAYELDAVLSQEDVEAGNPVTLTLALRGHGNLRSLELPELPDTPGFRTFDPKIDERLRATGAGFGGEKTWEYVLVPESSGTKEIGPWNFQYFDPSAGKYVDASAGPVLLRVSGAAASATANGLSPAVTARGEVKLLREDIRYLKDAPATLGLLTTPFYGSFLFYASLAFPVFWNVGFMLYLKRKEREKTHSTLFRSRRAHGMARRRLKSASKLVSKGSKDFYEEIAAALYRYIGDKKSVSPSGLTTESIDQHLEASGVDDGLRTGFATVLAACEEARFTPGERTSEEITAILRRAEKLIVSLDRQI